MKVNLSNFESFKDDLFDLSIVQKDVGGGTTSIEEIDIIQEYPNAKSLIISGLKQETFEYLIQNYGNQFKAISFWKNKLVTDLSPLGNLKGLEYLHYFVNQRVTDLWDMRKNENLRGLAIYDFTRLHSIEKIVTAPNIEYFSIGNKVWAKMDIESLKPLIQSNVSHFKWWGNKILDNDYLCLAQSKIRELDIPVGTFRMEELAELVASIPDLRGIVTKPYKEFSITEHDKKTTYYLLCKGKKTLVKGKDDEKLEKYLADFESLVEKYRTKYTGHGI